MKKVMLICIWIAVVPFSLFSCKDSDDDSLPPPPESEKRAEWELVFEENFDGNVINPEIWSIYNSVGHAGNGVRSPEAISIEDGLLVITAQMKEVQENVGGVIQTVEKLYSGGMAHKVNYKYGKFEFRVRSDADPSGATSAVVLSLKVKIGRMEAKMIYMKLMPNLILLVITFRRIFCQAYHVIHGKKKYMT